MITKDDIDAARERIRPHVHETPLVTSTRLGNNAGGIHLLLKCESMQRTGSFKARGALNAMMQLSHAEKAKGVVTVSAGNHAQALAWASSMVGAECITVMPEGASATKIEATKGYGGRVEVTTGPKPVADGLAAPMVGAMTLDATRRYVDDVVLVTDEEILAAMRELLATAKLLAEPAGAAATAALLAGKVRLDRGTHVVSVISGG